MQVIPYEIAAPLTSRQRGEIWKSRGQCGDRRTGDDNGLESRDPPAVPQQIVKEQERAGGGGGEDYGEPRHDMEQEPAEQNNKYAEGRFYRRSFLKLPAGYQDKTEKKQVQHVVECGDRQKLVQHARHP